MVKFPKNNRGIVTAKSRSVVERNIDFLPAAGIRHTVDITFRIRSLIINCRRNNAVLDRQAVGIIKLGPLKSNAMAIFEEITLQGYRNISSTGIFSSPCLTQASLIFSRICDSPIVVPMTTPNPLKKQPLIPLQQYAYS